MASAARPINPANEPATARSIAEDGLRVLDIFGQDTKRENTTRSIFKPDMRLRDFTRRAWRVVEPVTPFMPNWHIDAISEHLEACSAGQIRRLVINIPPRFMKSLNVSVMWPCWEWSHAAWLRYIFASYGERLAIRDSLKCRRILRSQWYQARWGDRVQIVNDQDTKTRFDNTATGFRIATSVDGLGTGEGGDRIVVDDPHNVREAASELKLDAVIEWWDQSMSTRGNDPRTTVRVITMQRVNERDLTGHVLAKERGYVHLKIPMEYDGKKTVTVIGWQDPRTKEGELAWPARFPREEVDALKKDLGSYGAAAQFQQEPAPAKGAIFQKDWFRYYTTPDKPIPGVHTMPTVVDEEIQVWDMSFKGDKEDAQKLGSDFVAGGVVARSGTFMYLLDEKRDQMELPETLAAVTTLSEKWPAAVAKYVEDKANGPAVMQMLRQKVPGLIPIKPEDFGGDKIARARAASPHVEALQFFVPHPDIATFDVDAWLLEITKFPRAGHDDRTDYFVYAVLILMSHVTSGRFRRQAGEGGQSEAAQVAQKKF